VSAAKAAGVNLRLDPQSETTMFSIGGVCPPGPCNWGLLIYADWMWNYGEGALLPSGDSNFSSGFSGNYWSGGYSSAAADKLIDNERFNSGIANVYKFENYISRQVAALWFPTVSTWSVVQDNLVAGTHKTPSATRSLRVALQDVGRRGLSSRPVRISAAGNR